jgi:DNA-binding SARP family transcriptional activator
LVDAGSPRQRCVLAALAVDVGSPVPLETLIGRVWGNAPPRRARDALYVYIAHLRRILAGADGGAATIRRRSHAYQLDLDPHRVDLHRFRQLVGRARNGACPPDERRDLLRRGRALWRGVALADVDGEWAERARDPWQQEYLDATVAWARSELLSGDPASTIAPLCELVARFPLVEPLVAAYMRALYAVGRSADALMMYAWARSRLDAELGAYPSAELQGLHRDILRGGGVVTTRPTAGPIRRSGRSRVRAISRERRRGP